MKCLKHIIVLLLIMGCYLGCKKERPPYHLSEDLDAPRAFNEGITKTTNGINFSKDGKTLYTSEVLERKFTNGRAFAGIYASHYKDGEWGSPELLVFENKIDAYHPVLSLDNQILFFNSRSHPDTVDLAIPHNIWFSRKTSAGWATPKILEAVSSSGYDSYPSIARNKNLYFNSDRPGGMGGMDIYVSRYENGNYKKPESIAILNSSDAENDLVVDPEERFIIFNRYIEASNQLDLYISVKKLNVWTEPVALDRINQPDQWELTPTLSPDGRYFFYELNGKIMQFELNKLLIQN